MPERGENHNTQLVASTPLLTTWLSGRCPDFSEGKIAQKPSSDVVLGKKGRFFGSAGTQLRSWGKSDQR